MNLFKSKRVKELEALVGHLKAEKRKTRRQYIRHLREYFHQYAKTSIEFLERGSTTKAPYLFVDTKGKIIGYTSELVKILGIEGELRGESYLSLFELPKDKEGIRDSIRKYFITDKERKVTYKATIKDKEKTLRITKEKPIYCHEVDLAPIGRRTKKDLIAFIPIKIEIQGRLSRRPKELLELMRIQNKEITEMYHDLITKHGWTAKQITTYETKHGGTEGLRKEYEELEKK